VNLSKNQELFEYYNERAPEYEAFYWGGKPAKIPDPDRYKDDTLTISRLLPDYVSGTCIDVACGTGFWLPVYEKNCPAITLVDQSEGVLIECERKIDKLGIRNKTKVLQADLFTHPFNTREFDSAVVGFLISYFNEAEMDKFFTVVKNILAPGGIFTIIDSTWNKDIAAIRKIKRGIMERSLTDGRVFKIYKQFFDIPDIIKLGEKYHFSINIIYWGKVFFLATGIFHTG
jgi:ubiquinone/menaquinone biosynthesis C-methylase UbiE